MTIFHNFTIKLKAGWAKSVASPILETINVNDICTNIVFARMAYSFTDTFKMGKDCDETYSAVVM